MRISTFMRSELSAPTSPFTDTMKNMLHTIDDAGILTRGFLMIGFPDDTEASMEALVPKITELPLDELQISFHTPTPGTPQFDDPDLIWVDPHNRYSSVTLHEPAVLPPTMTVKSLHQWRFKLLKTFYSSPLYRERIDYKIKSFLHLKQSFKEFSELLKEWGYA